MPAHFCPCLLSFILAPEPVPYALVQTLGLCSCPSPTLLPSLPRSEAFTVRGGSIGQLSRAESSQKNLMGRCPYQPASPMRSMAQPICFSLHSTSALPSNVEDKIPSLYALKCPFQLVPESATGDQCSCSSAITPSRLNFANV
jgi:hypothetical protein